MFIEVYAIPLDKWKNESKDWKVPENRRLVCVDGIRVRHSEVCPERAEIVLPNDTILHVAGSYDEILNRISEVSKVKRI